MDSLAAGSALQTVYTDAFPEVKLKNKNKK